ncbi:unnamed protein product, partial [Mesorhabditis belari]|uniref:Major facilitator superfamily (MFS) profile domain-containing protein n=1 Tax=Mesorhabditis belari TaxID=2138241 RepID=A0AAF3FFJ1_9BILA
MDSTQLERSKRDYPTPLVDPLICDPNKIVEGYGFWGRYQWWTAVQCNFIMLFYAANIHLLPFITGSAKTMCQLPNSTRINLTGCSYETKNGKEFCGDTNGSIILQQISPEPISSIMTKCFYIRSDHLSTDFLLFGRSLRKEARLFNNSLWNIIGNFACAAAPGFWFFVVLRFVVGALSDSYYTIGANYVCELTTESQRSFAGLIGTTFWAIGILYVGGLAQAVYNWRLLYLYMTLPSILCFFMIFTLPESPHWAIRHHKRSRIASYIAASNRWNCKRLNLTACLRDDPNEHRPKVNSLKAILLMLKSCQMWKIILIGGLMSCMMNFTYFAISLEAIDLSEDHFTAYMLNGVTDLPGAAMCIPLLHFFGRKWVTIFSGIFCGLALAAAPFPAEWFGVNALKVALILLAKFFNTIAQTVIPVWFPEMLPTTVRVLGFAIINFPHCIGQFIAPFFRHVHFPWAPLKYVVVGIACVLCSILCSLLSDTKGKDMPGDVHEVTQTTKSITQENEKDDLTSFTAAE